VKLAPREILFLEEGGFPEWMDVLEGQDCASYDAIVARLERVEDGNLGDCGPVAGGVFELRFMKTGPGYRIYFGEHDDTVVVLRAGTKKTQRADIAVAQKLWRKYNA
jgi:putative addiction module killer protein